VTKAGGGYLSVAPGVVRVQLVTDFLGETGHGASSAAQWFALVALVGALAYGALALARDGARARPLALLLAWTVSDLPDPGRGDRARTRRGTQRVSARRGRDGFQSA
jgi:hypothetical protein